MTLKSLAVQVKSYNGQCDSTCNDCATVVGIVDADLTVDGTGVLDGIITANANGLSVWQQGCACYANFQYDDVQLVDGTLLKPCDVCLVCGCMVDLLFRGSFDNIYLPNLGGVYGRSADGSSNIRMITVNAFDEVVYASSDTGIVISDAGGITFKSGAANRWNINDTSLEPSTDEGSSLGALAARVDVGYFGDVNLKNLGVLSGRNALGTANLSLVVLNGLDEKIYGDSVDCFEISAGVLYLKTASVNKWALGAAGHFAPNLPATYNVGVSGTGIKELHIGNAVAPGTPTAGYVIYATAGALFGKGSSGTITPLGAA